MAPAEEEEEKVSVSQNKVLASSTCQKQNKNKKQKKLLRHLLQRATQRNTVLKLSSWVKTNLMSSPLRNSMRSPGFSPHSSAGLSEGGRQAVWQEIMCQSRMNENTKKQQNLAQRSPLNELRGGKKSEQTAVTWRWGDSRPHCHLFAKPISRSDQRRYIRKQGF